MSDLNASEKRRLERLFDMAGGYVLDFSNRTFAEQVSDSTGRDIYDAKYAYASGSKANRLRAFWNDEPNHIVGKLISDLIDYTSESEIPPERASLVSDCRKIVGRLAQESSVPDLEALTAVGFEKDFEVVAQEVRDAIDKNRPEAGLDRLHTFVVKYVRALCREHDILVEPEKPLHSIFGEYVKRMRLLGHIRSEMAERILKSSISVLESFNHVRNDQSLAHDNPILEYDEALLIFSDIASLIRFVRRLETKLIAEKRAADASGAKEDIPF